jgi:sugar lactone lactonase YvrE
MFSNNNFMGVSMSSHRIARLFAAILFFCGFCTVALAQRAPVIDANWGQPAGQWDGATSWVEADGKGNIIVFVRVAPYFRIYTREGKLIRSWGEDGLFRTAHSVTYDRRGFIWATDTGRHVVRKYDMQGKLLQTIGTLDQPGDNASMTSFNQPSYVTVARGGDLYVSDGYVNARVVHLSSKGQFLGIIGGVQGEEPGQLKLPHGVAVDSKGRILVNDSDNKRISVFGKDGRFIETWPFPSRGGIVITADDTIYVSDVNAGAINIIRNGKLLDTLKVDVRPHGLTRDSDGTLYVSDALGKTVLKITRLKPRELL